MLFVLLSYALSTLSPYLNGVFVDFLITNKSVERIVGFASVVAAIGITVAILSYFAGMTTVKVSYNVAYLVLKDLIGTYEHADLLFLEKLDATYTTQRMFTDSNVVSKFVIGSFLSVPLNALVAVFISTLFFIINPLLSLIALSLAIAYFLLFWKARKPLYRASMTKKEADSTFFGAINSQVDRVFDIQLRSDHNNSLTSLGLSFSSYFKSIVESSQITYLFSSADGVISASFQAFLLIFSGIQIATGMMTVGEFTMVNAYFSQLLGCAKYFINFIQQYQDSKASYDRIQEISLYPSRPEGDKSVDTITSIGIERLVFSYPSSGDANPQLISNLSTSFEPNIVYAITGSNGCGKSTLLKLIAGLYDSGGAITVDGLAFSEISGSDLRRNHLSIVPQKLYAPKEPVGQFISCYLDEEISAVEHLLRNSGGPLSEYSTFILARLSENCDSLSGGELRKLYLWLAVHKKYEVLILDEPSTGLDLLGKTELIEFISSIGKGRIVLIFTHDPDLIKISHRILDLEALLKNDRI